MYEYKIKEIVKIYDGDSITVIVDLGFNITTKETFALKDIDTPEIKGEERQEGIVARNWLVNKINSAIKNDSVIKVKTYKDKKDRYKNYLCEIFIDDANINEQLISEGLSQEDVK